MILLGCGLVHHPVPPPSLQMRVGGVFLVLTHPPHHHPLPALAQHVYDTTQHNTTRLQHNTTRLRRNTFTTQHVYDATRLRQHNTTQHGYDTTWPGDDEEGDRPSCPSPPKRYASITLIQPPPPHYPRKRAYVARFRGWLLPGTTTTTSILENEHKRLVFKGGW